MTTLGMVTRLVMPIRKMLSLSCRQRISFWWFSSLVGFRSSSPLFRRGFWFFWFPVHVSGFPSGGFPPLWVSVPPLLSSVVGFGSSSLPVSVPLLSSPLLSSVVGFWFCWFLVLRSLSSLSSSLSSGFWAWFSCLSFLLFGFLLSSFGFLLWFAVIGVLLAGRGVLVVG